MRRGWACTAFLVIGGCGVAEMVDPPLPLPDAAVEGADAAADASVWGDASVAPDARIDAGADAGETELDAGPAPHDAGGPDAGCACSGVSECCDGCMPISGECSSPISGTGGDAACMDGECIGEPCECDSGPCCDGCFFRPATYQCATGVIYEASCWTLSDACSGYSPRIEERVGNQFCEGASAECDGEIVHTLTRIRWCWTAANPVYCSGPDGSAECGHACGG